MMLSLSDDQLISMTVLSSTGRMLMVQTPAGGRSIYHPRIMVVPQSGIPLVIAHGMTVSGMTASLTGPFGMAVLPYLHVW